MLFFGDVFAYNRKRKLGLFQLPLEQITCGMFVLIETSSNWKPRYTLYASIHPT